jgi:hypothetical protein
MLPSTPELLHPKFTKVKDGIANLCNFSLVSINELKRLFLKISDAGILFAL